MPLTLQLGHASDVGRVREINEDSYCVLTPPQIALGIDALVAVADGMGGHQAGEVASKYVTDTLLRLFTSTEHREWVDYKPDREDYYILVLKEIIERLNDQLHQMSARRDEWGGMGTTATIALIVETKLYIGHVGDSRAYLLANGSWRQLTLDHSWAMEQVEQGRMSREQAAASPRKNLLTRALGTSSLTKVDRIVHDFDLNDTLVLCTDGLTNMVDEDEIKQQALTVADPQNACQSLVALANQRGGDDNITIVIVRVSSENAQAAIATTEQVQGPITRPIRRQIKLKPPWVERLRLGKKKFVTGDST